MDLDDNKYFIDNAELPDDVESNFNYETVPTDEFDGIEEIDDDLAATVRILQEASGDHGALEAVAAVLVKPTLTETPPEIDDFILSYLLKYSMNRTLDCFQIERYELRHKGLLPLEDTLEVPNIYIKNQALDNQIKMLREERDRYKEAASKAREMYIKLRNERDYHKLQHRRLAQEKNKLIGSMKQLKDHYASYEPALQTLRQKYETAMKEKMLSQLERDRALGQVNGLRSALRSLQGGEAEKIIDGLGNKRYHMTREELKARSGGNSYLGDQHVGRGKTTKKEAGKDANWWNDNKRHPNDTEFPVDKGVNPRLAKPRTTATHLTRSGGYKLANTIVAHDNSVSSVALHPVNAEVASSSDDGTWKLWSLPGLEFMGEAKGHTDWLSAIEFNLDGSLLATSSGDTTVKIWHPSDLQCVQTFAEHRQAVWSVSWHSCGAFLASAGLEGTVKVWDVGSVRCRVTLRAHSESVNSVQFLPGSNILLAASADKTLSLWDLRKAAAGQNLIGHQHSVNYASFNCTGEQVVSCDSFGFVKLWDLRAGAALHTVDVGPHPANCAIFDDSGSCIAVASHEGVVKMIETATCLVTTLRGHEEAVQTCRFDSSGEILLTGSSDRTLRLWS